MGCWNKTCALTNLPIGSEERVVVFLLVQNNSLYESNSYMNWAWELIPVPFYGIYDDYGWFEPDEGQEFKLNLLNDHYNNELLRRHPYDEGKAKAEKVNDLNKETQDSNSEIFIYPESASYIRYPNLKDTPFENFEVLGESMHGNVFGIKDLWGNVSLLSHMMIREEAFLKMRELIFISEDENTSNMNEDYINHVLHEYINFDSSNKDIFKFMYSCEKFIENNLKEIRKQHNIKVSYEWYALDYSILTYAFSSGGSSLGYITSTFLRQQSSLLSNKDIIDSFAVNSIFNGLRKSFSPQGGEGSQEGLNIFNKMFSEVYSNSLNAYKSRYEDYE